MSLGCTTDDKTCLDPKLVRGTVLLLVPDLLQHQARQRALHLALLLALQRRNRNLLVRSLCPDMSWRSGH